MKARTTLCAALAALVAAAPAARAATLGDTVLSRDVKEADGTSGQDTNAGSGIKTGHLQNGAVTDAKIAGPISGSKLGAHAHAQSDVTGLGAALAGKANAVAQVVQVSASADPLASGAALLAALGSIGDASASKPYVVKLGPGVYDIGRGVTITGGGHVDLEGAGEGVTFVQNEGDPNIYGGAPVIEVWDDREVRSLTIRDRGTTTHFGALVKLLRTDVAPTHPARLRFVEVDANGTGRMGIEVKTTTVLDHVRVKSPCINGAVTIDAVQYQAPTFKDCEITSTRTAVLTSLPFTLVDSTVTGSLEFYDQTAHTATVVNSIVRTADPGFLVLYGRSGSTFRVLNSIVDGGAYGNLKCVNVVTSALDPLSSTCQPQ